MMMNHVHVNFITVKKVNFMLATARYLIFGNMAHSHSNYEIIWTSWPQRKNCGGERMLEAVEDFKSHGKEERTAWLLFSMFLLVLWMAADVPKDIVIIT